MKGTVVRVKPVLVGDRLRVLADVQPPDGEAVEATMPDREVAALLPRSILLGATGPARGVRVPAALLDTMAPMLSRMSEGREVRMWEYRGRRFFSFLPWKAVRFAPEEPVPS